MSYSIEDINGCTKKFKFNFETLDLSAEIKLELVKKQKESNMKGFRKGKAPMHMIEKFYAKEVELDALNNFIQAKAFAATSEEKLSIVGQPSMENLKYDPGKSVSFEVICEFIPEIKLKDYSKYHFSMDSVEVSDEDLEDLKKRYLDSKAQMVEIEGEVGLDKGMHAVLNFAGELENGERPENMKGQDFVLEIGSKSFIPGFEDGLLGAKKGDHRVLNLTFPADYHAVELQSVKVKFEVEVLEIKEKKVPALTEELAKEFGYESTEEFFTKNRKLLAEQTKKRAEGKLQKEILEKLVEENKFDIPLSLIHEQEYTIREQMAGELKNRYGYNEDAVEDYFKKNGVDLTSQAEFQVRAGLIFGALSREFAITVADADFDKKMEESFQATGLPLETLKEYYLKDKQMKQNLMYKIREEKTFEVLISKMNVSQN
ncbi:MAG: trigger factor [Bdellovibrionales bacterium RIFOXYD12_FULL_39_22]|nr:MAG: trigger factor [Bdellovibrionales bacterium RIFOXYB1_FULL_39_21]OFZ41958.1 MAG: trigger factor [Bdellovibrionales bacterium RIFOXYC12_FULL_39_17]OFZ50674.1 MAG: trigger factor [Bdellovibrionales bacterium RIFOXYC1_FULL_39_130]OFZ77897.1 MAG: trigger factor [Bdellovibrionales bacterium RIFOXYD1_FULL_39_84]OFZ93667.1 MAG: trigger factor [Bdellovibrionales bacterium RIFOXYD12_FULL_39_22]HLE10199.1 trigger factor [Bacteriovoracaceae bacterium]